VISTSTLLLSNCAGSSTSVDLASAGNSAVAVKFGRIVENWPVYCCTNGLWLNSNSISITLVVDADRGQVLVADHDLPGFPPGTQIRFGGGQAGLRLLWIFRVHHGIRLPVHLGQLLADSGNASRQRSTG